MPTAAPNAPAAPKSSRGRARRVAKWAGLVVCVVIAGVWVGSRWWGLWWTWWTCTPETCADYYVGIEGGQIYYFRCPSRGLGESVSMSHAYYDRAIRVFTFMPHWTADAAGEDGAVPLWIPLVLIAAASLELHRRERAWFRDGRDRKCLGCGYDRAGLSAESPCPECGAATSAGAKAKT